MISFLVPEIFKFSYYANLATDDVIGWASTVVWHKIKNMSANNEAILLKLSRNVAPYEIYQMVHILMLLWQCARFQSPASSKWSITICDSTRQNTWSFLRRMPVPPPLGLLFNVFNYIFCPMQLQMVIFDFKEGGTGTEHVTIATLKCVPSGTFLRVQHTCQLSIALLHYWRRYSQFCVTPLYSILCHTTVLAQPMTSSLAKITQ